MKKILSALLATAALSIAATAMAGSIVNTKHDLSSTGGGTAKATNTTQVCVFCHTPHNSVQTRALWNRNNPTASFKLYTSGANVEQLDWYVGGTTTLPADSPSLLCMSCHDGATSLVALGKAPIGVNGREAVTMNNTLISSAANLGTALTNDHPISLIYAKAYAGAPGTLVQAVNGKVGSLPLAKNENLECNTCHNVHDNDKVPFLRLSNDKSALCTACHIK